MTSFIPVIFLIGVMAIALLPQHDSKRQWAEIMAVIASITLIVLGFRYLMNNVQPISEYRIERCIENRRNHGYSIQDAIFFCK